MDYLNRNLIKHGFSELKRQIDWIINEDMQDTYDLGELVFRNAREDGGLTFNIEKAEKEILENYYIQEVFEFLDETGVDMKTASESIHAGKLHLLLSERDFNDYMWDLYCEKFENAEIYEPEVVAAWNEKLTAKEKVLATIIEIPNEYFEIDINKYPALKNVQEKMKKIENEVCNELENDDAYDINNIDQEAKKKYEFIDDKKVYIHTQNNKTKRSTLETSKPAGNGLER